ncbi:MAG TPA: LolA-related protein [Rhodocyclaceae bacterium]|nr:LolA-related protein [Rhodocyclaceae bacterium]
MKVRAWLGVPSVLTFMALPAYAWDLDALMHGLAKHEGGHARFVETKKIALLDQPVVSSGELIYTPPAKLEKRTQKPRPETMMLDGDELRLERGKQKFSVRLSDQPEALAFVDSLRGTLAGDRAALEKSYRLVLTGNEEHWTLDLLPADPRLAAFVLRITFVGSKNRVQRIRYLQADGDSSEMTIEPADAK